MGSHFLQLSQKLEQLSQDGPYAMGTEFTFADVATASWAGRYAAFEKYLGFTVPDTPEYARFNQWRAAVTERKSVQDTLLTMETAFAMYARLKRRYEEAQARANSK
jgi:glutathione S-transferase